MERINIENVTVFSDASFCPDTNAAGAGVWIKSNTVDGRGNHSIPLQGIINATQAEFRAVIEAFKMAIALHKDEDQNKLRYVMVCDCDAVVDFINKTHNPKKPEMKECLQDFRTLQQQVLFWKINKIKAHKNGTPRNWVNNHVDRLAKKAMKIMRAKKTELF